MVECNTVLASRKKALNRRAQLWMLLSARRQLALVAKQCLRVYLRCGRRSLAISQSNESNLKRYSEVA